MSTTKRDAIISIPASPTGTTETVSEVEISPATPSSATSSPDSTAPLEPAGGGSSNKNKIKGPGGRLDLSRKERHLRERLKRCRDKTLESELCRTINKYVRNFMSDDQCRRATAIAIMVLAVIGLYHILTAIF